MKHAIIGTGYWGSNHVRIGADLVSDGLIDSLVICDVDEKRVSDLGAAYSAEITTEYTDLNSLGVDTAVVATPSPTHARIGSRLLAEGIDLLIEKPFALNSDDAWRIVASAEENGCTLAVGHIFRYHSALLELKRRIDSGELGYIKYLCTNRFSFQVPRKTTGVLYSLAVHDVDIYRFLLEEEPSSIYCTLDSFVQDGIDETATLVMKFGDLTGVINVSWQVPVFGKRRDLTVVGSEGSAYIDYLADSVLELHDAKVVQSEADPQRIANEAQTVHTEGWEPLRAEVEHFLEACRDGFAPRASGEVGARTIELLEYARESHEMGTVVNCE